MQQRAQAPPAPVATRKEEVLRDLHSFASILADVRPGLLVDTSLIMPTQVPDIPRTIDNEAYDRYTYVLWVIQALAYDQIGPEEALGLYLNFRKQWRLDMGNTECGGPTRDVYGAAFRRKYYE